MSGTNKRDRSVFKQIATLRTGSISVTSPNGVAAAGANPTKAEYDAVVTLVNELKADLNALIAALRT